MNDLSTVKVIFCDLIGCLIEVNNLMFYDISAFLISDVLHPSSGYNSGLQNFNLRSMYYQYTIRE